jgi:hypothetical protein
MNTLQVPSPAHERSAANVPGSVGAWLAPLEALAENSPHFLSKSLEEFDHNGRAYTLPRYVYLGPRAAATPFVSGFLPAFTAMNRKAFSP